MTKSRSLWGRCKLAWRGFSKPLERAVLPMNSGNKKAKPNETLQITSRPQRIKLRIDRVFVSAPYSGEPDAATETAAAWIINDITIANKSQYAQAGGLPGDMFSSTAIDSFVTFDDANPNSDVVIVATYVGADPNGRAFMGGMLGAEVDDGPLDVFREIVGGMFSNLAKNLGVRSR